MVKSFTCIYAVISGLSSNSEFLHFILFIKRSLYLISSPFDSLINSFFELILSKILISVKFPSKLLSEYKLEKTNKEMKIIRIYNLVFPTFIFFFNTFFIFIWIIR